jgi:hypothetical protein
MLNTQVYVGTYHKYNNGSLKGIRLDLGDYVDSEDFFEACHKFHSDEDSPEFMFQDYEDIGGLISESHIDPKIWEVLELSPDDQEVIFLYATIESITNLELEDITQRFRGTYRTDIDFAEEHCYEHHGDYVEEAVKLGICIDWEGTWNSWLRHDFISISHNSENWYFSNK